MPPHYPYLYEGSRSVCWVIQLHFSVVLGRKRFRDVGCQRDHLASGKRFGEKGRILDGVAFRGENGLNSRCCMLRGDSGGRSRKRNKMLGFLGFWLLLRLQ